MTTETDLHLSAPLEPAEIESDEPELVVAEFHVAALRRVVTEAGVDQPDLALDAMLAIWRDVCPTTQLEAAIGLQIAVAHAVALDQLGRARQAQDPRTAEAHLTQGAQLQQSMAALVQALARLRASPRAEDGQ